MGMGGISIWQLLIVLVIVLLLFGTKKLRNLGTDLGGAVKGFRSTMKDGASAEESSETEGEAGQDSLVESAEEWPVFCAHDKIREVIKFVTYHRDREGESHEKCLPLSDFNWIDKGLIKTAKKQLTSLPYQGLRWYSR